MSDEPFSLRNDPPRPKKLAIADERYRQRMLLAGLDCLAGQQDLFETDGQAKEGSDAQ